MNYLKTTQRPNCKTLLLGCVSFVFFFFLNVAIDYACVEEFDTYDSFTSFFHNRIEGADQYGSFYYNSQVFLYKTEEPADEHLLNATEWARFLGKGVKISDVLRAMYNLNGATDSVLNNGYLQRRAVLPDSLASNTFLQQVVAHKSAGDYYRFAKKVEKYANSASDPWNPTPVDSLSLIQAGNAALALAKTEKDFFIQQRYYYQAQRLLHYGKAYAQALDVYKKYLLYSTQKNHINGLCMSLYAGELRRTGKPAEAAYWFSRVFTQYPEKRVMAYVNYHMIHPQIADVLFYATNSGQKTAIEAIHSFNNIQPDINTLKRVYQLDPSSPLVGFLLVRELNKIEDAYVNKVLKNINTNPGYTPRKPDKTENAQMLANIAELKNVAKQMAAEAKMSRPNTAILAMAYLSWVQGNTAEGLNDLKLLNNQHLDDNQANQQQIIALLLASQQIKQYNTINENAILPALQWLDAKSTAETMAYGKFYTPEREYYFARTKRDFLQRILAPAYLRQHDTAKAALLLLNSDVFKIEYINSTDRYNYPLYTSDVAVTRFWCNNLSSGILSQLISWRTNKTDNGFIRLLSAKLNTIPLSTLYELQGTAYLREHQYAEASACFAKVDAHLLNNFPKDWDNEGTDTADPFIDRIADYPLVYKYANGASYNKLQYARAMASLAQQIKSNPANPLLYYKYATGLYNASTFGNAWYLLSYGWSGTDHGRAPFFSYDADYIKASTAAQYYRKACDLSTNPEFKAKCIFMQAKCLQKSVPVPGWDDYANRDKRVAAYWKQLRNNPYFAELKDKYRRTAFTQKAMTECSFLKDYVVGR